MNLQVTACARCNSRKGQKTLEQANMKLRKIPRVCYVAVSVFLTESWLLQQGCFWSGAITRLLLNCTAGAQGVRYNGCALDKICIQNAQEEPWPPWSVAAVPFQTISLTKSLLILRASNLSVYIYINSILCCAQAQPKTADPIMLKALYMKIVSRNKNCCKLVQKPA